MRDHITMTSLRPPRASGLHALFALLALLLAAATAAPALAGGHPDFTGTWVLDLEASEPLEPLLRAQNRSWAERKLADSLTITQVIKQSDGKMVIDISSAVNQRQDVLIIDGSRQEQQTERAGTVYTTTKWSEDGQQVITVTEMVLDGGVKADMITTRGLAPDGQTTHLLLELKFEDGRHLKAKRVLRKQP